jgi:phospholipase/carboxylesterase
MHAERVTWGGLNTILLRETESKQPPEAAVVLCHGFGAPASDLVALGPALMQMAPDLAKRVLWVFPAAPIDLADAGMAGGLAWWPIDMAALLTATEERRLRDLRRESPPELPAAREAFFALLRELKINTGLSLEKVALGGFSQGAMLTTDVSLRLDQPPAALCILSGTLLCESQWTPLMEKRGKLRVFQSHGTSDPILPFENATALRDLLVASGAEVEFLPFDGDHGIPIPVIRKLAAFLGEIFAPAFRQR